MGRYSYHRLAAQEFLDAVAWYRSRDRAVGLTFVEEVDKAIGQILEHPEASPVLHSEGVRRRVLQRFPYGLYYVVDEQRIRIVAVGHHKRRPAYWMRRLRKP